MGGIVGDGLIKRRSPLKLFFNIPVMALSAGMAGIVGALNGG